MWSYVPFSFAIIAISLFCHRTFNEPISIIENASESYDYIVVGAGTAGCVMASRLSENPNSSVLLVEAGGYFDWISSVPLAAPLMINSHMDWAYKTEPQWYSSKGFRDQRQNWPRGKGLGGSGQINFLVHSFGRPEDFSKWPGGWSYFDLQPYFKKVAAIMNVRKVTSDEELVKAVLGAGKSLKNEGENFWIASDTLSDGSRWSTYHAYLQRAWNRKNLHILPKTLVMKVNLDLNSKIEGVVLKYENGTIARVIAKKEVVLSAGTISTPQLLMLSGIGPATELERHKIPVIKDISGVGQNLFDHLYTPIYVNLEAPVSFTVKKIQSMSTVLKYFLFGTGMLASNGVMAIGRVNNSGFLLFGSGSADEKLLKDIANYQTEVFRSLFPSYKNTSHEGFIFMTSCFQPKSRGNITLRSNNILDYPAIDPSYLEDDEDVKCSQEAIKLALKTLDTVEFLKLGAKVHVPNLTECQYFPQNYWDDNFSECVIRISAYGSHHPSGTCKMGTGNDSVVDSQLRVKDILGLRIVDASVFPAPVSGNPNSVIIAMAERAADFISSNKK
ncbi:neither inactivation nor afterpotential protein G-like [Belonocnema kinseyi]|uniref:neither inactivation nor afterpotential protein G-like n=1 Tax=Belonocnema kinseyi TaxID=2817044 RepID=UPI00143DEB53|nr:neither inactivation nor afterpotential protein G-like [Belonocnema kinseyi]